MPMKARCGYLKKENSYWKNKNELCRKFCSEGSDNIEHSINNYKIVNEWLRKIVTRSLNKRM